MLVNGLSLRWTGGLAAVDPIARLHLYQADSQSDTTIHRQNRRSRKYPVPNMFSLRIQGRMTTILDLPLRRPVPLSAIPPTLRLRIVGAAGAGFPSPAQDWEETAINLVELLRLDRAASFVFRVSGSSMIDAGLYDNDVVVVDRDAKPSTYARHPLQARRGGGACGTCLG